MKIKAQRFTAILLSLVLVLSVAVFLPSSFTLKSSAASSNSQRIANLNEKIKASQEKIDENNSKKSTAQQSANSLQTEVDALQTQITAYNDKIDALNDQIAELNDSINDIEDSITKTEAKMSKQKAEIAETQSLLGDRLSAMYVTGNVSNLEILLEADSFENFLNRLELISRVSKHDNDIISELKDQTSVYEKSKAKLEAQEASLQTDKQSIQSSKTEQQDSKSEIVAKKATLDEKVDQLNTYISGLDANSSELQSYIASAESQMTAYSNTINSNLAGNSSTGSGTYSSGSMTWPVPASHTISSGYGYRSGVGTSNFHYGIDISAPHGSTIVASGSGTVKISSNACPHDYPKNYNCGCNGGYGNYVVIDHGNGLLSYYGHMANTVVSVGQTVAEGQTIGYVGSSGYSTGNHCHFEIRVNNGGSRATSARNPLNYVSP